MPRAAGHVTDMGFSIFGKSAGWAKTKRGIDDGVITDVAHWPGDEGVDDSAGG